MTTQDQTTRLHICPHTGLRQRGGGEPRFLRRVMPQASGIHRDRRDASRPARCERDSHRAVLHRERHGHQPLVALIRGGRGRAQLRGRHVSDSLKKGRNSHNLLMGSRGGGRGEGEGERESGRNVRRQHPEKCEKTAPSNGEVEDVRNEANPAHREGETGGGWQGPPRGRAEHALHCGGIGIPRLTFNQSALQPPLPLTQRPAWTF